MRIACDTAGDSTTNDVYLFGPLQRIGFNPPERARFFANSFANCREHPRHLTCLRNSSRAAVSELKATAGLA